MKIHMLIQIYKQAESQDIEFLDSIYANYDDACAMMIKALFENASTGAEFRVDSVDVIDAVELKWPNLRIPTVITTQEMGSRKNWKPSK